MIQNFEFHSTIIPGLLEITPFYADDKRGCFTKDYSKEIFEAYGLSYNLLEVFYTTSLKGVIRALHFQRVRQQAKLVRCITGKIFDVVVDLRKDSPCFKKWVSFELSCQNRRELLIPAGCAHGYLVLEDSIVSYKCDEKFYGEFDDGILWNDPELKIMWPLDLIGGKDNIILSEKDRSLQGLEEFLLKNNGGF